MFMIAVLTYASMKVMTIFNQDSNWSFKSYTINRDLNDPQQTFDLSGSDLQVAYGSLNKDLPPRIGQITANYTEATWKDGNKIKNNTKMDNRTCPTDFG